MTFVKDEVYNCPGVLCSTCGTCPTCWYCDCDDELDRLHYVKALEKDPIPVLPATEDEGPT